MPDSIGDEKALKRPLAQNRELVRRAEQKIEMSVQKLKNGRPAQDGIGFSNHLTGLFGQRLYFRSKTKAYSDKLKIDKNRCIRCGKCVSLCPMKNISLENGNTVSDGKCTMCYRCINFCPTQAITLFGKRVYEQCHIEKYIWHILLRKTDIGSGMSPSIKDEDFFDWNLNRPWNVNR